MHDGLHVRGCRVGEPSLFPSVCLDDKFSTLFVDVVCRRYYFVTAFFIPFAI